MVVIYKLSIRNPKRLRKQQEIQTKTKTVRRKVQDESVEDI